MLSTSAEALTPPKEEDMVEDAEGEKAGDEPDDKTDDEPDDTPAAGEASPAAPAGSTTP